jgi:hypothetical protein
MSHRPYARDTGDTDDRVHSTAGEAGDRGELIREKTASSESTPDGTETQ